MRFFLPEFDCPAVHVLPLAMRINKKVHVQLTRAIARMSRTRTRTRKTRQLLRTLHVAAVSALHVAVICALHVAVRTLQFERSRSRSCSMVGIQCIVQSERRGDKRPTAKPKPFSWTMLKGCNNSHKHSNCQDCLKKKCIRSACYLRRALVIARRTCFH